MAYSSMSSAPWGLLDDSAVVFFIWMFWVRHCKFDYVLHECVPAVPIDLADSIIGLGSNCGLSGLRDVTGDALRNCTPDKGGRRVYEPVGTIVNSPTDFGVPCNRRRRYSRWKLTSAAAPQDETPAPALAFDAATMQTMFYRRLTTTHNIYMVASSKEVQSYYRQRAAARQLPCASEVSLDVLDVIPACARVHLQFCKELRAKAIAEGNPVAPDVVCLMQSPHQIKPDAGSLMPALLTGALPFSLAADRLLLPDELMLVMGMPSLLLASAHPNEAAPRYPYRVPLAEILRDHELRRQIGNGMHLSQIGSALLLVLCEAASCC